MSLGGLRVFIGKRHKLCLDALCLGFLLRLLHLRLLLFSLLPSALIPKRRRQIGCAGQRGRIFLAYW
jgi:hypothetical protein